MREQHLRTGRRAWSLRILGMVALWSAVLPGLLSAAEKPFPLEAKRILFLGDSITHAGHYVAWIETQLRLQGVTPLPEIIQIGLSSETCSGLSEKGHPFPRPDVHERLDRALEKIRPDVVVACYGMNDGIYHPFSEERFTAYQRGIDRLISKAHAAEARVILLTPPPFDPVPLRKSGKLKPAGEEGYAYFAMYEGYNDVLRKYGEWILAQKDRVAMVVDLHRPFMQHLLEQRKSKPEFTLTPDGIHPNRAGHRLMAETILDAWGVSSSIEPDQELLGLVTRRTALLHDAWLSEVGHQRPGVKAGLPLEEARTKAAELAEKIDEQVAEARQPKTSKRESTGGVIHQVSYPATAGTDALQLSVDYMLWIPEGAKVLRGVIVHQHGCGPGASLGGRTAADDLHWQALARKWDCALMGSSYEPRRGINCRLWCDSRNGSDERFLAALTHFSEATGHAELKSVPWCLWGHSGGGFWASLMQVKHPERIVAIWLRSGTAFGAWTRGEIPTPEIPAAAYQVPVMGNPGLKEKDHERFYRAWEGITEMQKAYRAAGAPFFEFAPDPRTAHECGDSRYLAIPFFDFWLAHRLPASGKAGAELQPATPEVLAEWKQSMQNKHDEYVRTGAVTDTTPPPAPANVQAQRTDDGHVVITWNAAADLESGIRGFVIERDGKVIAEIPEKGRRRFGRSLFQGMSYHDTPEAPLPQMRYIDRSATGKPVSDYDVRTINSEGLKSK